ncbi:hypothetical protein Asru_0063_07 [Acidisphaera rubrifaciens HS-AP3]|uniref:Uncharacterized protein n=1 Tax=Acidisphaera rubrifaciens HS-AP3 TaxID=1231350 RepID=A0A0D6P330_9PROT|nr:hypothetical protein Asru_0063_07 [Acidisphaera rubrifaciens HS-AP3]
MQAKPFHIRTGVCRSQPNARRVRTDRRAQPPRGPGGGGDPRMEGRDGVGQGRWRCRPGRAGRLVLLVRIELTTSPLPRECSTTELQQRAGPAGEAATVSAAGAQADAGRRRRAPTKTPSRHVVYIDMS